MIDACCVNVLQLMIEFDSRAFAARAVPSVYIIIGSLFDLTYRLTIAN